MYFPIFHDQCDFNQKDYGIYQKYFFLYFKMERVQRNACNRRTRLAPAAQLAPLPQRQGDNRKGQDDPREHLAHRNLPTATPCVIHDIPPSTEDGKQEPTISQQNRPRPGKPDRDQADQEREPQPPRQAATFSTGGCGQED
jgi:hypothetical protein